MANKKKLVKAVLFLIPLAGIAYFAYDYFAPQTPTYMTINAATRDIKSQVFASGTLAGKIEVDVGAQVSGQIKKLYVNTGDVVKKGDLLCEIDPEIQQNDLKTAKAQLKLLDAQIRSKQAEITKLKLENDRQARLLKNAATSKQEAEAATADYKMALADLDALKAQYEQAEISVSDAETNLGYTKITAPMDGTVYAIPVEEGQTVNANQTTPTILKLAKLDVMTVETEISEADVVKVRPGMECSFTILGLPNREFKTTLSSIDPAPKSAENETSSSASSSSSTEAIYYNAQLDIDNSEGLLRIDMTAEVNITIDEKAGVLSVPLTAIRDDDFAGNAVLYLLDNKNQIVKQPIKTGIRDEQYIEVISGIGTNDRIIIGDDVATAEAEAMSNLRGTRPRM